MMQSNNEKNKDLAALGNNDSSGVVTAPIDDKKETVRNTREKRRPTQKRSQEKYDAILDACPIVLNQVGYRGFKTTQIAKESGVAVGTIYDYFEDKDAIVEAFVEREMSRMSGHMETLARMQVGKKPFVAISNLTRTAVEFLFAHQALLKLLIDQVPGLLQMDPVRQLEDRLLDVIKMVSWFSQSQQSQAKLEVRAQILTHLILGFMLRTATNPPNNVAQDEIVNEMVRLIVSYLQVSN